ncbi:hypothetical protein RB619_04455 [Flavobacterium sp. LHD-80]|uniref:hypothetical protein n=1 Tax=Flavobacterium sp. LHD-80 TaxID=3071411 RepID=UPI0027E1FA23|nr:hypothetical protein [Flavobacterium sp. LHD-80]MDQ6469887.1 hypothetical protein [Flavobacterium sp. LHD-80]
MLLVAGSKEKYMLGNKNTSCTLKQKTNIKMDNKGFHKWLRAKNCFEYSEMNIEFAQSDAAISLIYKDTRGKAAFEEYLCHKIAFKLEQINRIYSFENNWCDEEKKHKTAEADMSIEDFYLKMSGSDTFAIQPIENKCAVRIENWWQDFSAVIDYENFSIITDEVEAKTIEPKLSEDVFDFKYKSGNVPKSNFWVDTLATEGMQASFIDYFCNPVDIDQVCPDNYSGWSIRPVIEGTWGLGAKICIIDDADDFKTVRFDFIERKIADFIDKIKQIVLISEVENIKCGNVVFSKEQWKKYVFESIMPEI